MDDTKLERVQVWRQRNDWHGKAIMLKSVCFGLATLCLVLSFMLFQALRGNSQLQFNNRELLRGLDRSKPTITIEPIRTR
jgi:hypothetical protein